MTLAFAWTNHGSGSPLHQVAPPPTQGSPSRWSPALSSSSPPSTPPDTEGYKDNSDFQSLLPDISSPRSMIINNPFLVNKKKKIADSWEVLKHSSVT